MLTYIICLVIGGLMGYGICRFEERIMEAHEIIADEEARRLSQEPL